MAANSQANDRESFWREVLARHTTSGLSIRAFCQQEQLRESAFYVWRRRIVRRDGATTTASTPAFVPALVTETPSRTAIEIEFRDRWIVRLDSSTPASKIAELIHALESAR